MTQPEQLNATPEILRLAEIDESTAALLMAARAMAVRVGSNVLLRNDGGSGQVSAQEI